MINIFLQAALALIKEKIVSYLPFIVISIILITGYISITDIEEHQEQIDENKRKDEVIMAISAENDSLINLNKFKDSLLDAHIMKEWEQDMTNKIDYDSLENKAIVPITDNLKTIINGMERKR